MKLPKIDLPTYEIKIPSNGKKIRIRPFIVKEEKLLLMAIESKDDREIINVTKQIIQNCIIDDDVDVEKLTFFDIDYLFIALRAKSIGESIEVRFTCNAFTQNNMTCGEIFPAMIDISNCDVIKDDDLSPEIHINPQIKVKMKYPNYTTMKSIMDNDNILNKKSRIIAGSIDYIQDKDKVFTSKDVTRDELISFVENMTQEQYKKLEEWVDNFPYFVVTAQAKCPRCSYNHDLEYRDFTSFFV